MLGTMSDTPSSEDLAEEASHCLGGISSPAGEPQGPPALIESSDRARGGEGQTVCKRQNNAPTIL